MFSGFFKGTGVATRLRFRNNQGEGVYYNIDADGNFTLYLAQSANHGIDDFPNGWKRIWFETVTSGEATNYIQIYPDTDNGTGSVYAWGMQAEEGSYVTSYIPCYGTSNSRLAESCRKTSATALIGQTEGTMFAEIEWDGIDTDRMWLSLSDGTSSNRMHMGYDESNNRFYFNLRSGNAQQALIVLNNPTVGSYKIAGAYKENDVTLYINGTQIGSDSSTLVAATSQIDVGGYFSAGFEYPVKRALLFPTRLSNADLATLTA